MPLNLKITSVFMLKNNIFITFVLHFLSIFFGNISHPKQFLEVKKSFSTPLHLLHVTKIYNCTLNSRHY